MKTVKQEKKLVKKPSKALEKDEFHLTMEDIVEGGLQAIKNHKEGKTKVLDLEEHKKEVKEYLKSLE